MQIPKHDGAVGERALGENGRDRDADAADGAKQRLRFRVGPGQVHLDEEQPVAFPDGVQTHGREHGLFEKLAGRAPVRREFDHKRFPFQQRTEGVRLEMLPRRGFRGWLDAPPDGSAYHKERERAA